MIDSELLVALRATAERAASRVLLDRRRAEDVAQDVIVRLLEEGVGGLDHPDRYVARMARFAAIDIQRARKKEWVSVEEDVEWIGELIESQVGPSTMAGRHELFRQLLEPLTASQRTIFLASLDGVTNAEIAERFGYKDGRSVAVILTRIRKEIRKPFEDDELKELLAISAPPAGLMPVAARADVGLVEPEPISAASVARAAALADALRSALSERPAVSDPTRAQ
ncbi:RNA polymerase sigma factor [Demequina gelatinilytica]|uniref:RNA polymerase sigma factor n=1 Tax=Demequina gelatinilytica TaxID=1638980 RepID=UPI001E4387B7|nr:sigma-70 family RNA polymerase sigma factor [Demequina gelatinilytica]